jgi:hypothetical protein
LFLGGGGKEKFKILVSFGFTDFYFSLATMPANIQIDNTLTRPKKSQSVAGLLFREEGYQEQFTIFQYF